MGLKKILFLINLFALLIGVSSVSYAQKFATLTGTVKDSSNGEPLIGVNIFLENTTLGAATDVNGFYVIPAIPPGNYRVVFQYMGYRTLKKKLRFLAGQRRILHIALRETVLKFGQIRITAEKEEGFDRTVEPGVITISPRELQKIDRKSTRLNSSHTDISRMPSSA